MFFTRGEALCTNQTGELDSTKSYGSNNDIYQWLSAVPDEIYPSDSSKLTRAETLFGVSRIGYIADLRDQESLQIDGALPPRGVYLHQLV